MALSFQRGEPLALSASCSWTREPAAAAPVARRTPRESIRRPGQGKRLDGREALGPPGRNWDQIRNSGLSASATSASIPYYGITMIRDLVISHLAAVRLQDVESGRQGPPVR